MKTRKEKALETREKILKVAKGVFMEKGFHKATTEEIAVKAEVSKGSIFSHFKDKEELAFYAIHSLTFEYTSKWNNMKIEDMTIENFIQLSLDASPETDTPSLSISQLFFSLFLENTTKSEKEKTTKYAREILDPIYQQIAQIFAKFNLENSDLLARVFIAILDGLALQLSLENRLAEENLFNELVNVIQTILIRMRKG